MIARTFTSEVGPAAPGDATASIMLAAEGVSFAYGRDPLLTNVSFSVKAGEITAIIGPNGAGKTTLLKVLAGLLDPSSGTVHAPRGRTGGIAYLAQSEELPPDWTVREVVELGRMPYVGLWRDLAVEDREAAERAMGRTGVLSIGDRIVETLSGGERQRVALARALAQEPQTLLLDEPTTHLDLRHQVDLFAVLRAEAVRGVAAVAVMHDLSFAGCADRCILLSGGTVRANGRPAEVLVPDLLLEVYSTTVEILHTDGGRLVVVPAPSSTAGTSAGER